MSPLIPLFTGLQRETLAAVFRGWRFVGPLVWHEPIQKPDNGADYHHKTDPEAYEDSLS